MLTQNLMAAQRVGDLVTMLPEVTSAPCSGYHILGHWCGCHLASEGVFGENGVPSSAPALRNDSFRDSESQQDRVPQGTASRDAQGRGRVCRCAHGGWSPGDVAGLGGRRSSKHGQTSRAAAGVQEHKGQSCHGS